MNYAIKITDRDKYIDWCNKCWYTTVDVPVFLFTKEECMQIYDWLDNHYVYDITLIGTDGSEEHLTRFSKHIVRLSKNGIPTVIKVSESNDEDKPKKSIFKLSISSIKKSV